MIFNALNLKIKNRAS